MSRTISQKRFMNEALEAHNKHRREHNAPELELDKELCELAREWAEELADLDTLKYKSFFHNGQGVGENILRAKRHYMSGLEATREWYKEIEEYRFDDASFQPNTGHFTQLVWRDSQKVGFGFALTEDGKFYVVANYWPAGNYKNEFMDNVYPKLSINSILTQNYNFDNILPKTDRNIEYKKTRQDENIRHSGDVDDDEMQKRFIAEALEAHNTYRRKHGCEPLVLNPELNQIALSYSKYLAGVMKLIHSKNTYRGQKLGENLAYSYDSTLNHYPGAKATQQWYDEIKMHDFHKDYQKGTGHFTQVRSIYFN